MKLHTAEGVGRAFMKAIMNVGGVEVETLKHRFELLEAHLQDP